LDTNNHILSIAGFDPSSGAGLTSDIKTFETFGFFGLSVCTSITVQNDINFKASHWVDSEIIINQITTLFDRFNIDTVKIGIVESWDVLNSIVNQLLDLNSKIKIIVDPVLKSSSGFDFHSKDNLYLLDKVLEKVYLITPNYDEIQGLYPDKTISETIDHIKSRTNIYLKGGHRLDKKGWDELYYSKNLKCHIPPIASKIYNKHGSGCVLSSALTANLKAGLPLEKAAFSAKKYIEKFLNSNETLLGIHDYEALGEHKRT
jgi:hydroxymethylpyrimidine/phosphomethylpyrimidine kinase